MLPSVEQDLEAGPAPALVAVWLGANDAALANSSSGNGQHVPLAEYSANLAAIVRRLRAKAPSAGVLLVTPPPVDERRRLEVNGGDLDRSNAQTGAYAEACVAQAAALGLPVLDLFALFGAMDEGDRSGHFLDGLHLNSAGNSVVARQLEATIRKEFPALARAMEAAPFPEWDHISSRSSSGSGS